MKYIWLVDTIHSVGKDLPRGDRPPLEQLRTHGSKIEILAPQSLRDQFEEEAHPNQQVQIRVNLLEKK